MGSNKKSKKSKANTGDSSEPPSLPPQDSNNHAKSNSKSKGKFKGKGDDVITDPRFSSVHWDPRFQNVQKHKAKVAVDSRFDRMFTDKRFGSASGPIDKRGKRKDPDQVNPLRSYYRAEEDEGKSKPKRKEEEDDESTESDEEVEESGSGSESDDVASGESESTTDSDTETDEEYEDDEAVFEDAVPEIQEENIPEIEKETHRLAIVNLDWDYVKAVDLYVVLRSFVPKDGVMKSVAVYPSEFGLQRMKEEETRGPVGLSDEDDEKTDEDDDEDGDDDDDLKVRAYIKSRLRYYFAVVECDSIATADYLYKNCDGLEFERSSNKLDLRFIPDSMEFKHPPRDIATEVPTSYAGLDFQTPGLQLTKCDVPFDQDDPGRRTLRRAFDEKQLDDLNQYMASSESESDGSENDKSEKKNKKLEMYRTLLLSGNGDGDEDEDGDASNGESGDEGQHMEITFNTGLEDISKRILEKKDTESETVWEGTLRKRRERKKARKNRAKGSSEDESSDTDGEAMEEDDFFMEEPSVKKSKKVSQGKKSKKEENQPQDDKEAEASRNELELLLADDNGAEKGLKGYNLKRKKTKGKKGKEAPEEDRRPNVDLDDPRFSAVFTSSAYAVDPTDPQFQRNVSYARQVALRQSNGGQDKAEEEREVKSDTVPRKIERSALVKSLKMKTMPFAGKMSKEEENSQSRGKKKEKKDKQVPHPTPVEPVLKKRKTKA